MTVSAKKLGLGDRYDVVDTIGGGAAAFVHKVRDRRDGTIKAAKLLRSAAAANPSTVRRFEDEFRVLRGLHHPSLPEVYDYGWTEDGSRFMVMEFVDGQRLDEYLRGNPDDLWVILYELCEVLTFIHSHNLLHQDIKPDNVLVKRTAAFGQEMPLVVLIDFGLTFRRDADQKVTMVGTPEYMAPEIIRGETPLTRAVDYYSLGVSLYQFIVGELPFTGNGREVFDGHLNREVRFRKEKVQYAELYPHIRGLMSKDKRARLEAFEEFRNAVIGRMTGGIEELEKAYGLAHINSLGMIGKEEVWEKLMNWLGEVCQYTTDELNGQQRDREREVHELSEGLSSDPLSSLGVADHGDAPRPPSAFIVSGDRYSGKTVLADRFRDECSTQGLLTIRLGQSSDVSSESEPSERVSSESSVERWARVWNRIDKHARSAGAIILVDDPGTMTREEQEFLSYVEKRLEFNAASGDVLPLFFVVLTGRPDAVQELNLPIEPAAAARVRSPSSGDIKSVIDSIGDRLMTAVDRARLESTFESSARTVGIAVSAMRRAIATGSVEEALAETQAGESRDTNAYYLSMLNAMPEHVSDVVRYVSCHRGAVSTRVLADLLGSDERDVIAAATTAKSSIELTIQRTEVGVFVRFENDAVRRAVYSTLCGADAETIHRGYVAHLESESWPSPNKVERDRDLIFHHERTGETEKAFAGRVRLIRALKKEKDWAHVVALAQEGLDMLRRQPEGSRVRSKEIRTYFVKQCVEGSWAHNDFAAVRSFIEGEYVSSEEVPKSLMARHVRSLRMCESLTSAQAAAETYLSRIGPRYPGTRRAILLESALIEANLGSHEKSLEILGELKRQLDQLTHHERCRMYLYYGINWESTGRRDELLELCNDYEVEFRDKGFFDEYVLLHMLKASALIDLSRLESAMSVISSAIKLTHDRRLHLRRGGLYFQASAVYYERGDFGRARRYLERAIAVMEEMGSVDSVADYSLRFAMINVALGLYGNAVRYLEKARIVGSESAKAEFNALISLVALEVSILTWSPDAGTLKDAMATEMLSVEDIGHKAYYYFLIGEFCRHQGDPLAALASYEESRKDYERWGCSDDAARSALGGARAIITMDRRRAESLLEYVRSSLEGMESEEIQCQYAALRIAMSLEHGAPDLEVAVSDGIKASSLAASVHHKITLSDVLFRAFLRLGRKAEAERAFQEYYGLVKRVVSNLPIDQAKRYVSHSGVNELLTLYKDSIQQKEGRTRG